MKLPRVVAGVVGVGLILSGGAAADAGWFGPSKDDVSVTFEPPASACPPRLGGTSWVEGACCVRLCFTITNKADRALNKTEFKASGTKEGRSTKYEFKAVRGGSIDYFGPITSDAIIQPGKSQLECFNGMFQDERSCSPLNVATDVVDATFAK